MSARHLFVALIFFCMTMRAQAGDVREQIPNNALGVIAVTHLSDIEVKLEALGKRLNLPIPSLLSTIKTELDVEKGIDEQGMAAFVAMPSQAGPTALLYLPVKDYADFISRFSTVETDAGLSKATLFGRTVLVGKKQGFAVVANETDRTLLEQVLSSKSEIKGKLKMVKGDHHVVMAISRSGIELITDAALKGLSQAKVVVQAELGEDNPAVAGLEVYVQLLQSIRAEVMDAAAGISLEEDGSIRIDESVWPRSTGKLAELLEQAKPAEGDLLAGLPKMPFVMAFGIAIPTDFIEPMMDFSGGMMMSMQQLYGLTPNQIEGMVDLSKKYFSDIRGMSFAIGVGREGAPLYSEMIGAIHVTDAKAYMQNYRKFWTEFQAEVEPKDGSLFAKMTLEEVQLDGKSALKVTMPLESLVGIQPELQGPVDFTELMEKLYGPGGMSFYLADADEHTVLLGYTDTALLKRALNEIAERSNHLSHDPSIVDTSKLLPAGSQVVGYWSPKGIVDFVGRAVQMMSPDGAPQFPKVPDSPAIGFSMLATRSDVQFHTVVPGATIDAVGHYIEEMQKLRR